MPWKKQITSGKWLLNNNSQNDDDESLQNLISPDNNIVSSSSNNDVVNNASANNNNTQMMSLRAKIIKRHLYHNGAHAQRPLCNGRWACYFRAYQKYVQRPWAVGA